MMTNNPEHEKMLLGESIRAMEKDGAYTFFVMTNEELGIKFNCTACNAVLKKEAIYCQQYISCTACEAIIQVPSTASEAEAITAHRRKAGLHHVDASGRHALVECSNRRCSLTQFRVNRSEYYGLIAILCPICRS
jgi:hypothetical protein